MKILYVLPSTGVAGGASQVFEHIDRLNELGHEVKLATLEPAPDSHITWYPFKAEVLPISKLKHEALNSDIVVATHYVTAFYINDIQTNAQKYYFVQHKESLFIDDAAFIISQHPNATEDAKDELNRFIASYKEYIERTYNLGFKLIATSDWLKTLLKDEFGQDAEQVYCCLNDKIFYPEPYYPRGEKIRVLLETTAQKTSWKGTLDAKEVLEGDPELRSKIEVWTLSADNALYTGDKHWKNPSQDEIRRIYSSCDINLKMSWYEGWGLGPMQAMACGCAVVSSDNYGINTYAKNEVNALITPNRDIESARAALKRLVEDRNLRNRLIDNGLETVKKFSFDKEIKKLESIFQNNLLLGPLTQLEDMVEYSGETIEIVKDKMSRAEGLVSKQWEENPPKTEEEIVKFYSENELYPYNILDVNTKPFRRYEAFNVLKFTKELNSKKHLDFGGGVGDLLIYMSHGELDGMELDYYDVPGRSSAFARWRFKKHGNVINAVDSISGQYDSISVIDVLEHVVDPIGTVRMLLKHLKIGGGMYINAPFFAVKSAGFNYPMHLESNAQLDRTFDQIVKNMGLEKIRENMYKYNGPVPTEKATVSLVSSLDGSEVKFRVRKGSFDQYVVHETFVEQSYRKNGFDINKNDTIIDIGAHIGTFSVWAASQANKIYAYEPFSSSFELLKENLKLNGISNVVAINKGVWSSACQKELGLVGGNLGANSVYLDGQYKADAVETIECTTLNDIFKENDIVKCNLLKLDCEGAEYDILYGLDKERFKDIDKIVMEFHEHTSDPEFKHSAKELVAYLSQFYSNVDIKYITDNVGFIKASK